MFTVLTACRIDVTERPDGKIQGSTLEHTRIDANAVTPAPQILWQTGHETGDFYDWSIGNGWQYWDVKSRQSAKEGNGARVFGQAIFNSQTLPGDCVATISNDISRNGEYSLKLALSGADKAKQSCRVFRLWLDIEGADGTPLPDEAYYSAWYYIPQEIQTIYWWNIFQFKSGSEQAGSEAMLSFNIDSDGKGKRSLYVVHKKGDGSCDCTGSCEEESYDESLNEVNLPIQQWFQIEAFVNQSTVDGGKVNSDGALKVWVDGIPIIEQNHICTLLRPDAQLQWSVNNYTDDIIPSDVLLYIDDAAISTLRLGVD